MRRLQLWTLLVMFLVITLAAVALVWQPWIPRVVVGGVTIKCQEDLADDKTYNLVLWDYEIPITWSSVSHREALQDAVAGFEKVYPNVSVTIEIRPWDEGDGPLRDRLESGNAPDVVGMPQGVRLLSRQLQIPLEKFFRNEQAEDIFEAAQRGVTWEKHMWAWPRWIQPARWALRLDRLPKELQSPWQTAEGKTFPQDIGAWTEALVNSRTKSGTTGLVANVFDPLFFYEIMLSSTGLPLIGPDETVQWPQEMIEEVASTLQDWVQRGIMPKDLEKTARTRLASFWAAKTLALAPTNPWLWQHLLQRSGILSSPDGSPTGSSTGKIEAVDQKVMWVPPPLFGDKNRVAATVGGYAVFRQQNYQGHDHTQAAVLLADHLSRTMGSWEAARLFAVPAHPTEVPEWIAESNVPQTYLQSLLDWSTVSVTPPIDDGLARAEERLLAEVVAPGLVAVLEGNKTPQEFAADILTNSAPAVATALAP